MNSFNPRKFKCLFVVVLVLLSLIRCQGNWKGYQKKAQPNFIFVTVDTLRADHTPFGGYKRITMPNSGAFFQDGLNFRHAETVRTSTTPAYASLFTGVYPYRHGVRNLYYVLHEQNVTLAEVLRKHGYSTAAFVSSFAMIGRLSGLHQGFDLYDDVVFEKELNRDNYERRAANTVLEVQRWLQRKNDSKPFFLFLHFIDPHGPYHPPEPYGSYFRSSPTNILRRSDIPEYQFLSPLLDQYQYIDRYDGEIAYLDKHLEALYQAFERKDLTQNSWFLFTADHGESLGERGLYFGHGHHCYAPESRINMVWLPPTPLRSKFQLGGLDQAASLVDVMPTILDLAGIQPQLALEGETLVPAMEGKRLKNSFRFSERVKGVHKMFAAYDSRFKLIFRDEEAKSSWEFYDVLTDPGERKNLINQGEAPKELRKALESYISKAESYGLSFHVKKMEPSNRSAYVEARNEGKSLTLSPEDTEKLRALGYVN